MASEKLARRYATAVFSLAADASNVDRVGDDLATASAVLSSDPSLAQFFTAPIVDRSEKEAVLARAFGELDEIALHALLLLVRKRRERLLSELVAQYRKLQLATRGQEELTVASARTLKPDELHKLVDRLERVYAKTFDVRQVADPALIGGVRVYMGDRRIDGSIAGRLDALARTLFATPDR